MDVSTSGSLSFDMLECLNYGDCCNEGLPQRARLANVVGSSRYAIAMAGACVLAEPKWNHTPSRGIARKADSARYRGPIPFPGVSITS